MPMIRRMLLAVSLGILLAISGAHADITSNLEAWYKMDEGTGTATSADSTANGHTMTLINSPAWQTGGNQRIGTAALGFNGTTQRATLADSDGFTFSAGGGDDLAFSIGFWMYLPDLSRQQGLVTKNGLGGTEWHVITIGGNIYLQIYNNAGVNIGRYAVMSTSGVAQNTWECVVVTYSGSNASSGINIYIDATDTDDGDAQSAPTHSGMVNTTSVVEIASYGNGGNLSNGRLDEIRIWRRELSSSDVTEFCNYTGVANAVRRRIVLD